MTFEMNIAIAETERASFSQVSAIRIGARKGASAPPSQGPGFTTGPFWHWVFSVDFIRFLTHIRSSQRRVGSPLKLRAFAFDDETFRRANYSLTLCLRFGTMSARLYSFLQARKYPAL